MKLYNFIILIVAIFCLPACAQNNNWQGKITYGYSGSINTYSLNTKTDKVIFADGAQPYIAPNGEIFFLNTKFPKVKELIRKYTSSMQFKDVLDMSAENPVYKDELANYSIIRGTGIAGIMDGMSDPKVSPNGKFISVTIYGGYKKAFTKNCVAIFDLQTKQLLKKFDDKYYGTWTADNRLLMCGSHKNESVNGSPYKAVTPGIFLTDNNLNNIKRLDPELDDPSPYHAVLSPDSQKIAYVLNRHIWMMDIDGKNNHQLTDVDRDNEETYPIFSPDGKYIACWTYKTFEKSYFTAIAIVPTSTSNAISLTDKATVWPKDQKGKRISGGSGPLNWTK